MTEKQINQLFKSAFTLKNIRQVYSQLRNKNSKGIDKIGEDVFEIQKDLHFRIIKRKVLSGTYSFSPYLQNLKLKGRDKFPRVISIPTIRDRIVLKIIKELLHIIFPESVNKRLPNFYISDIKKYILRADAKHFYQTDIMTFYDRINRNILIDIIKVKITNLSFLSLLENAVKNVTVPQNTTPKKHLDFHRDVGIPQGLSISNILSNIYLHDFDNLFLKRNYLFLRYVDDILILSEKPLLEISKKNIMEHLLKKGLELHESKTFTGPLTNRFDYLGYNIGPVITVSQKNIQTFISSIAAIFTQFKSAFHHKTKRPKWLMNNDEAFKELLIEDLNDRITGARDLNKKYGWLFFFSEITDKNILFSLDKLIRTFFYKSDIFENKVPTNLKKLVRTFFEIKYNPNSSYILDYNTHDTTAKKLDYLVFRGILDPKQSHSIKDIELHYIRYKIRQLNKLEKDTGYNYI
jgi:RNA-directed DNA polymerase